MQDIRTIGLLIDLWQPYNYALKTKINKALSTRFDYVFYKKNSRILTI